MQRIRRFAAFLMVVTGLVFGTLALTGHPQAASASAPAVYSQSSRTEMIYGDGRCIHTHTRTVRNYGWKTKMGRYVLLAKPSVTVSDSYKCHA